MDLLRFLLRLPFMLCRSIFMLIKYGLRLIGLIFKPIIGNVAWQSPRWVAGMKRGFHALEQWTNNHPKGVSLGIVGLIAAAGASFYGYNWHLNQPKPIEAASMVYQDTTVDISDSAYNYQQRNPTPQTLKLTFSNSAAPVTDVGKVIESNVTITPEVKGEWKWESDNTLVFTAKKPLKLGDTYVVKLDAEKLLAPQIKLDKTTFDFKQADFGYTFDKSEFFQDPQDPKKKSAIFEVTFNAPVDVASFEKQISLATLGANDKKIKDLKFSVVYDEKKLTAWVHSEKIQPMDNGGKAQITLNSAIKSTVPANEIAKAQTQSVTIPELYSLSIDDIDTTLVEKEGSNGERALLVALSDDVSEKDLKKSIRAWLLPPHNPADKNAVYSEDDVYQWRMENIDQSVVSQSAPLDLVMNETEQEYQSLFSFKLDVPYLRQILVEINNSMTSTGGYQLRQKTYRIVTVPDYPKMLRFMSQGSLLSMNGEKRITVATRNMKGLKLDIKRVIPSQLQHIASFKNGVFTSANFHTLSADYFTEHFEYKTALPEGNPTEVSYQGIDLSRYLSDNPSNKRGIFLLSLNAWTPKNTGNNDDEYEGNDGSEEGDNPEGDSRFIVITDLGIIAKKSQDNSRDVFVQSIQSGQPVEGAKVSVVAKNGVTLLSQNTDANGHVSFPALDAFKNERQPVMYLVEQNGDVSFLPTRLAFDDREIDLSRFDVSGDEEPKDSRTLSSYLFSDRGVYRPGDTFNIGLITRTADWTTALTGVPLRAEIRDPRDTLMNTIPLRLDATGFNELNYTTGENAPTGEWSVYLYLEGKDRDYDPLIGHTTVNVKEFEPDTMKVKLQLTPDRTKGWVKPLDLKASIDVQNMFGTPAQDRRVTTKLTLRPVYPSFEQFPDYMFYENSKNSDGFESELQEQKTDENGLATLPLDLKSNADATYQLQLLSEAFEAGSGRSVAATARVLVSPYDSLVGVKGDGALDYITRDAERHLSIIAIDPTLKKIALPQLKMALVEQKYISVLTKQDSGVYKYQSKMKEEQIAEQPFEINAQGSDFVLATNKPGNFVLVIKNEKDQVLNRVSYTVAGNANVTRSLDRNAELNLKLNQAKYLPGQEIEISIDAPYTGSGLITIERDKVYAAQWFHTDTTSSVQRINVPDYMEGNGYINVQFVRDANSDEIFMSPLSYGVIPFKIDTVGRKAGFQLSSDDVIKPGQNLAIKVTTDSPQRMVVFAVDEGILQVARYTLKDPLDYFFRKRQLSVESTQILDLILPEFSKLISLTSAAGGDAGEGLDLHLNPFKRKRDKPVTYWSGITEVNGEEVFNYPVPDYFNGKIRVMAISVTPDRIGKGQSYTTVRDDFILTPNVPAMVAPGDEFDVSVGVANNLQGLNGNKVDIKVQLTPPPQLEVVGEASRSLSLAEKREGMVTYRLRATNKLGDAPLTFNAVYGDKSSLRKVSTSVRPVMPYRVQTVMGRMSGKNQNVDNLRQMFNEYSQRQSAVSHSPLVLTNGLAQYLSEYPYYCSEQIVSRSIPLILQSKYPEMRGKLNPTEARKQVNDIITTLRSRQNGQGAIGAWRSTPNPDAFVTPYVVQYLLEAKDAGFAVPEDMLKEANASLRTLASSSDESLYDMRLRTFAVYLLTRQGEVTTNAISSIQERLRARYDGSWETDLTALYLASSYRMLKMDAEADKLLQPTWKQLSKAYSDAWWSQNYFDPLVQDATRLYLITRHFPEEAQNIPAQVLENMVSALKSERYTTLSSAMSILALESYSQQIAAQQDVANSLSITAVGKNNSAPQVISTLEGLFAKANFGSDTKTLKFSNTASVPAWYVVAQSGYDIEPPKKAISNGLEVTRDYTDEAGKAITKTTLGQKINVHVKIRSNSQEGLNNIAIVDLLPGGFEVVQQTPPPPEATGDEDESSSDENETASWVSPLAANGSTWQPDYSDIRDDRVIIYGSATNEVQEFVYQIKSTNTGVFMIPPAYGEAMYDREVQAVSVSGGKLTVVAPEEK